MTTAPVDVPLIGAVLAPDLHVMTYNVRRPLQRLAWPRSDRWSVRQPRLAELLHDERPSILGAQEVLPEQADVIGGALGTDYRFVGHGRQRGPRGEACPIFFDAERLQLLSWTQVALSDRPDVAGSASWGNVIPRVAVQATMRDRASSTEFLVINTHLDAFSARARERAALQIRRAVADQPLPAMVLGDFNTGPHSAPVDALLGDDELVDA